MINIINHIYMYIMVNMKHQIGIDGEMLSGSLPVKKYKLLQAWMILHEDELYKAWNNAVRGIPFDNIKPLD